MVTVLFTSDELTLEYPTIVGLVTSLRHLKVGHRVTEHPDFQVEYCEDIESYDKKSKHATFSLKYIDDDSEYLLIKNRGTYSMFYPKYKQVDYLICSIREEEINEEIIHKMRKLKDISLCFALEIPNQKEILNFTQLL